jgi:hypothetical protein
VNDKSGVAGSLNRRQPGPTPARLTVVAWPDPVVDAHGHRPESPYIAGVWLGTLGPSATWAWVKLAKIAAFAPGSAIDTVELAASLGLGRGLGPNAAMSRTIGRMVAFGAAARSGDTLAIRRALPDIPSHQLGRLSRSAQLAHRRWASTSPFRNSGPESVVSRGVAL